MPTIKVKDAPEFVPTMQNYAHALRAIGQDLATLYPVELEILVLDSQFAVTGVGMSQASGEQINKGGVVRRALSRFTSQQRKGRTTSAPLHRGPFTRQYSLDDINRLDEAGQANRAARDGKPDIYSLGERLRTVGRIVDGCGGTLTKIVKERNSISFEYRDQQGNNRNEDYTNLALYKYQQRYYAERGIDITIDP